MDDGLMVGPDGRTRCWWPGDDAQYLAYHDTEWGVPVHDDRRLFEKVCLEGFQSGLSWLTILRKREAFREVFDGFDPEVVAGFDEGDVRRLLDDARIIRHRGKIEATIANARCVADLHAAGRTFDELVWSSSRRGRGFRFVGPTTAYAFMQSMGMVDDHMAACEVDGRV